MTESGKIRAFPIKKDLTDQTTKKTKAAKPPKKPVKPEIDQAAMLAKFAELNQEDYREISAAPRRRAREAALLLAFQMDMGADNWETAANVLTDLALDEKGAAFALQLAQNADSAQQQLDAIINKHAHGWTADRFAAVDRNILRLAIAELIADQEDSSNIIINEAIELAKKFGDDMSGALVNGILDAVRINELPQKPQGE
jgi:N utilization substance protein B